MERRDGKQAEKSKAGEEGGTEVEDAETTQIDHESENAGEAAAFSVLKPSGINFHHAGGTKGLEITINAADGNEEA